MKRISIFIIGLAFILGTFVGCTSSNVPENNGSENNEPENETTMVSQDENVDYSGTYEGEADGYGGKIKVKVSLDEVGKISKIEVDENHSETENIAGIPINKIPESIISSQSLDVDVVSGATVTSDGILEAVANALKNAGLDAVTYGFQETKSEEIVYELDLDSMPEKTPTTDTIVLTDVKGREVSLDLPISTYGMSTMDVIDFIIPILGEDAFHMLVASGQDGGHGLQGYAKLYTPIVGDYMNHVGQISDHNAPFDLEMKIGRAHV